MSIIADMIGAFLSWLITLPVIIAIMCVEIFYFGDRWQNAARLCFSAWGAAGAFFAVIYIIAVNTA